eukprot:CAMPEP_0195533126 /NCGR_PEP_ID=MMETSP0794_2-20130614/39905_1 /TAXON_ID=515487 /ORGANISM="Stephanopyxis turris, Strain CCMP 815" /LENGTH=269 /DNA_ID=CAMNT_0040665561 /DNA_START=41 /DNA_END=850 /DNA_ORIENTATION=+
MSTETSLPPTGVMLPSNSSTSATSYDAEPLAVSYPVNSYMELTLEVERSAEETSGVNSNNKPEVVRGTIYTTDEISNSIVLMNSLSHTTLSSEIRVVNGSSVISKKILGSANAVAAAAASSKNNALTSIDDGFFDESTDDALAAGADAAHHDDVDDGAIANAALSFSPLPAVSKKDVEERERRAIRLAEESFGHINQKASAEGQTVFDRLVKACNDVVWSGESIIVLNQVRVDPPYRKEDCKLVGSSRGSSLNEGSLERVKKIVVGSSS